MHRLHPCSVTLIKPLVKQKKLYLKKKKKLKKGQRGKKYRDTRLNKELKEN